MPSGLDSNQRQRVYLIIQRKCDDKVPSLFRLSYRMLGLFAFCSSLVNILCHLIYWQVDTIAAVLYPNDGTYPSTPTTRTINRSLLTAHVSSPLRSRQTQNRHSRTITCHSELKSNQHPWASCNEGTYFDPSLDRLSYRKGTQYALMDPFS